MMLTIGLQAPLTQSAQHWLTNHLNPEWFVAHPLAAFGLFCLVLFLGLGLLSAIARLTESIWLFIARLLWRLAQWLLRLISRMWQVSGVPIVLGRGKAPDQRDRAAEILTRLRGCLKRG